MNNGLVKLVFLLAEHMPEEAILDAIVDHKLKNTEQSKLFLLHNMSLYMTKAQIDKVGIDALEKDFHHHSVAKDMFSQERKS